MILDRNVFVLLLLIAYVKGEPQWNLKYPHEVYVQDRNNPLDEPVIGCISRLGGITEVVVPACSNPMRRELTIWYKNAKGEVVKTEAELYRETESNSLLLLTPMPKIERSRYTIAVSLPLFSVNRYYMEHDSFPIVAKVTDADGREITFTINGRPKIELDRTQRLYQILIDVDAGVNYRLVKGATLVTDLILENLLDQYPGDPSDYNVDHSNRFHQGVIGMFDEHRNGMLYFNIYDKSYTIFRGPWLHVTSGLLEQ